MSERQDMRIIERLAREMADLRLLVNKASRSHDMQRTAIDSGPGLEVVDPATGETAWRVGANADGVVTAQVLTGPDPAEPSAADLSAGLASLEVRWDGLDASGNPAAGDAAELRVYSTTEETLEPVAGNHVGKIDGKGGAVTLLAMPGTWTVRTEIVTLSGKVSAPSAPVTIEIPPLVDEDSIREALENAQSILGEAHNEAMDLLDQLEQRADEGREDLAAAVARLEEAEALLIPLPGRMEAAEERAEEAADAALAAQAAATEANARALSMIPNGSFEQGLDYWSVTQGNPVVAEDPTHSGGKALSGAGVLDIAQEKTLPIASGQIWEVSGWTRYAPTGEPGTAVALLTPVVSDSDGNTIYSNPIWNFAVPQGVWTQVSGRFTAPANSSFLRLGVSSSTDSGTMYWDDITLRNVTDVVRLEAAAQEARKAGLDAQADAAAVRLLIEGADGIQDRLDDALTGPVDHDRLRVGEGAFDEVFADEVIAGIIGAKKAVVIELIAQDLIANNATLISAAMQDLTVTEKATFAEAFAEQLWAKMAVIDRLTAETAWITDAMISNLSSEKLTVTEELWAKLAQFAVIEAGMIRGDALEGQTFTGGRFVGALFETLAEASRGLKWDTNGIRSFDQNGNLMLHFDSETGKLIVGSKGVIEGGTIQGGVVRSSAMTVLSLNSATGETKRTFSWAGMSNEGFAIFNGPTAFDRDTADVIFQANTSTREVFARDFRANTISPDSDSLMIYGMVDIPDPYSNGERLATQSYVDKGPDFLAPRRLLNGWSTYSSFGDIGARVHAGRIEFRGAVRGGDTTLGSGILNLPTGVPNPSGTRIILAPSSDGPIEIRISTAGLVYFGGTRAGGWVSLDGLAITL